MRHLLMAIGCVAAMCAGCTDEKNTTIQQIIQGASLPGNFPGAPVTTHMVAADGQALSESGHTATGVLRYFASGVGNRGIVLYTTTGGAGVTLWAQYFDGSTFTPPVALTGGNQDPTADPHVEEACVLFLNTQTAGRDGDALIFFRRDDLADASTGVNTRLYYSYFDRSLATTAVSTTDADVRYGFDSTPAAMDTTSNTGVDVTAVGLVSDGLAGAATFLGQFYLAAATLNQSLYFQGEPVTYAAVTFVQATAGATTDPRVHVRLFDLSSANGSNMLASNQTLTLPAGAAAGDDAFDILTTYNGSIFFMHVDTPGAGQRMNLCWNVYGSAAATSGFLTTTLALNVTDLVNDHQAGFPFFGSIYGSDDGVTNLVFVTDVSQVGSATNRSVFAYQVDPAAGTFNSTNDRVEIDADTVNGGLQIVSQDSLEVKLNRTGEWILTSWVQERGTGGTQNGRALWARAIQTTRSGTAPAITTRTSGTGAQQVDSITADTGGNTDQIALDTSNDPLVKVPDGLGYREGGTQSNRYVTHLIWQQDQTSGTAVDILRTRRLTFTPSTGVSNPSALTFGTEDQVTFSNDAELANAGTSASAGGFGHVVGADGGGAGGSSGDLLLYYVQNTGTTANPSFRAFQRRQTGSSTWASTEIGSLNSGAAGSSRQCFALQLFAVRSNTDIVGSPDWAGVGHHLLFFEARESDTPLASATAAMRHRYYDKGNTNATIANRFTPVVGANAPAVTVDTGSPGNASFVQAFLGRFGFPAGTGVGETAGIYLMHNNHLWYNQWDPVNRTWITSGGGPAPELVDHESGSVPTNPQVALQFPAANRSDNLNRAIIFWHKFDFSFTQRWQARVRD